MSTLCHTAILNFVCAAGLYAERVGAVNFISKDKETATKVLSQFKKIARAVWSNPPVHGAAIAAEVVGDSELFEEWNKEMEMMAGRIKACFTFPLHKNNRIHKVLGAS